MGYFDALTSGTFKTGQDGQRLFFPWGTLGRGYVIESEADYERLRRQIKICLAAGMIMTIGPISVRAYLVGVAALAVWYAFYFAWMAWRLPRLQSSTERLTRREVMVAQARAHGTIFLWVMEICSLGFVISGIFILTVDPKQWLVAVGGILFFGLCAFLIGQMIAARRPR